MIMKKLISSVLMTLILLPAYARTINIHGLITLKGSGEPVSGVTIYNAKTNKLLGITGDEGRYHISADSEDELIFSGMSCQETRETVNGRLEINVSMIPEANELNEVVVMAQGNNKTLITEPADLDVKGNHLSLKTKVKIPAKLFSSQVRMIIQPCIYNVTARHLSYLTPVVYDGWRYADTQERMYDWDLKLDSLTQHRQVKTDSYRKESTVYIIDSLYVHNPKDDYMGVIMSSLENYNNIIYTDTFEIARGTVNPLRFLDYDLPPMLMEEERFLPTPEVELRDASGEMNLIFPVGKSELDFSLGNNATELQKLIDEFRTIENAPDMTLKKFSIFGYASPEGKYASNRKLASRRMESAMSMVLQSIDPSLRRNAEISSDAEVSKWEEIVAMLRVDSLDTEADAVGGVIDKYKTIDAQSKAMTRLPFYKTLLKDKYLPRLRRVSYNIVSSRYRPLTDDEIAELYVSNPKGLSKYQFYRYYSVREGAEREQALKMALSTHPDFVVAATDLSEIMLKRGENPKQILKPFFDDPKKWDKLPQSTRYNMGVACMDSMNYSLADSILSTVDDTEKTHKALIYCKALNGHYQDVMQEICEDSPLNEVLLLLAVKDNNNAAARARKLGNSAVEEYVKAIAANRLDDYLTAINHLENAFRLDPSLKEVAKVDGDVIDLLDEEDINDTDTTNAEK